VTLGKVMYEAPDKRTSSLLRLWRLLGPGLVTGAADDDPSGIGTHSQSVHSLALGFRGPFYSVFL
jgi:Mn2+/Fe2+ NRAMP family transporter